jgi:hypothetical protein
MVNTLQKVVDLEVFIEEVFIIELGYFLQAYLLHWRKPNTVITDE